MPNAIYYEFTVDGNTIKGREKLGKAIFCSQNKITAYLDRRKSGHFEHEGKRVDFEKVVVQRAAIKKRKLTDEEIENLENDKYLHFTLYRDYLVLHHYRDGKLAKTYSRERFESMINSLMFFLIGKK